MYIVIFYKSIFEKHNRTLYMKYFGLVFKKVFRSSHLAGKIILKYLNNLKITK